MFQPAAGIAPRLMRLLIVAALLGGGEACAEQRPPVRGDSAAAGRSVAVAPEASFRARLGRTWELARLGDQDIPAARAPAAAPAPGRHPGPGSRPTIRFTDEPREELSGKPGTLGAGGWSFCNGYGTAYELGPGGQLRFHGFHSTLVGCDGPDSLETRFFRGLANTRRFVLDSDSLTLLAEDGSRLTFFAAADSGGPAK